MRFGSITTTRILKSFSFTLQRKLCLAFVAVSLLCVALVCVFLYFMTKRMAIEIMRHQIMDSATLVARQIDPAAVAKIRKAADKELPEFKSLQDLLDRTRKSSIDISNIYIFRLSAEGKPSFVVDEPPSEGKESAEFGELVGDPGGVWEKLLKGPSSRRLPHADDFISSDRFGDWLSGFAPIGAADGSVSAYLGIDLDAGHVRAAQRAIAFEALLAFLLMLPVASALGWVIGRSLAAPLIRLRDIAQKMKALNFDCASVRTRDDEIGDLVEAFDAMRSGLKSANEKQLSAQQEINEKNAFLRQLLDAMPYPVFYKNAEAQYAECNESFASFFANSIREKVIGRKVEELLPASEAKLHASMDALIFNGEKPLISYETKTSSARGEERYAIIYKAGIKAADGSLAGIAGSMIDISSRKRMEDELREAKKTAEAASLAKSRFLANVSHEVKTPLNGMQEAVELLKESASDETQKELLETIAEARNSLIGIIGNLIDLAKIESGEKMLEERPCSLLDLAASLAKSFEPAAKKKGLALKVETRLAEEAAWVCCDPERLRQILGALADNAIKFTASGQVELKIERLAERREGDGSFLYRFSTSDTGIGIEQEKIGGLFDAISQSETSAPGKRHGCGGLELLVCSRLVQLMGGTLKVESVKGAGSTFSFEMPLKNALS